MIELRQEIKKSTKWGALFFIYCLLLCFLGQTIVPVDRLYIRGNMPWKQVDPELSTSRLWNLNDNRSGDAIYQTPYAIKDQVRSQEQKFSYESSLGYPQKVEYGVARGLTVPITLLLKKFLNLSDNQAVLYSTNLVCGIWSWVSFILLWLIGFLLFGTNPFNWVLAIICHPTIIVDGQESWLIGLTGILMVLLAIVYTIRESDFDSNKFWKDKKYLLSFCLATLGTILMFRSMIFHYYLYVPMLFLFSYPIFHEKEKRSLFIYLGIALTAGLLIELSSFLDMYENLAVSNKSLKTASSISDRGYAFFPVQQLYQFSLYKPIIQYFKISWNWVDYFFSRPYPFLGFNVLALGLIGLIGRSKGFLFFAIFVILYWMGPSQYLLSILFKGPFATESSGRMGQFVMILLSCLAIGCLLEKSYLKYAKYLKMFLIAGILFLTGQMIVAFIRWQNFTTGGFFELIAAVSFLLYLSNLKYKKLIFPALVSIPLSVMFFFAGKQTLQPFPASLFDLDKKEFNFSLSPGDVGALVKPVKKNRKELHPTFWYNFDIRSLHAYRNPYHFGYTLLFWSQWDHNQKISPDNEKLLLRTRLDRLIPLKYNDGKLNYRAERFLDLTGANVVALPAEHAFKEVGWDQVYLGNGIRVYKRDRVANPFRFVSSAILTKDVFDSVNKIYESDSFNWVNMIVSNQAIGVDQFGDGRVIHVDYKASKLKIKTQGQGILLTNVVYYKGMKVADLSKNLKFNTFECNASFLCVIVDNNDFNELSFFYE